MNVDEKLAPFDFELPEELIAQEPAHEREAARLLVVQDAPVDASVLDLAELLPEGTLLVVNDTQVVPARLEVQRESGGRHEVFVIEPAEEYGEWTCLVRGKVKPGTPLAVSGDSATLTFVRRLADGTARVRFAEGTDVMALLGRCGSMPVPPYIRREATELDRERYQTTFARVPGAVAAPTAGLHFGHQMRRRLSDRGIQWATVTLHVGLGTFSPLSAEQLEVGELHAERYEVPAATAEAFHLARAEGRPVCAVGTTVVRTLESAFIDGSLRVGAGRTRLFIRPGYRFRAVDALVSNFHLPCSSLLMLVCAFAGTARVMAAYRHAVAHRYRFFSYGDATLSWRQS